MKIYLGGHLNFYHPEKGNWLEVEIGEATALVDVIQAAGIPLGEVHLVVLNGEAVALEGLLVRQGDEVRLFSPAGGG